MEGLIMINLKKNIWMFHTFDWQTPMTVIVQTMLKNCSGVGSNLLVQLCYISFWKGFPRQICFKLQNQCKHSSYLVPVTSLRIKFNVSCISVFTSILLMLLLLAMSKPCTSVDKWVCSPYLSSYS